MLIQIPLSTSADSHPPLVSFPTPVDILHATYISYLVFISLLTILRYFNLLIEINSSKVIFLKWKRTKKKPSANKACMQAKSLNVHFKWDDGADFTEQNEFRAPQVVLR